MTPNKIALLALCASLGFIHPAFAQDERVVHVSFADLNLASASGAATLKSRVDNAVRVVCDTGAVPLDLTQLEAERSCRTASRADADRQMARALASASTSATFAVASR